MKMLMMQKMQLLWHQATFGKHPVSCSDLAHKQRTEVGFADCPSSFVPPPPHFTIFDVIVIVLLIALLSRL